MNMTPQEYQQYVKQKAPKSPLLKDTVLAFVVGGAICVVGQLILNGWTAAGLEEKTAGTATSCTLVFLSALLTGLNLYNKLARFGGARVNLADVRGAKFIPSFDDVTLLVDIYAEKSGARAFDTTDP